MTWWQHIILAASWLFCGWHSRAAWRAFKTKTRTVIPWKEVITDPPEKQGAMIMALRMDNAKLRKEIEQKNAALDRLQTRQER